MEDEENDENRTIEAAMKIAQALKGYFEHIPYEGIICKTHKRN